MHNCVLACGTDSDFQGGGDREQCGQGHGGLLASDLPGRWIPFSQQDPASQQHKCEEANQDSNRVTASRILETRAQLPKGEP